MRALNEGREPAPSPTPAAAHDEAEATAARIATMANGKALPTSDGQADDPETAAFVQRMRAFDAEELAARAIRAGGAQ
jgi:hypothetical protein